uniref:Uncharacterized protein n=1 Tax=Glossina palpalis gambiensis TaxID=67801 RepID=A0A1B0AY82_9MUSC
MFPYLICKRIRYVKLDKNFNKSSIFVLIVVFVIDKLAQLIYPITTQRCIDMLDKWRDLILVLALIASVSAAPGFLGGGGGGYYGGGGHGGYYGGGGHGGYVAAAPAVSYVAAAPAASNRISLLIIY